MTVQQRFLANLLRQTGLFTEAQLDILLKADLSENNGIAGAVTRLEMAKEAEFLEKFAREQFLLQRRGEDVFVIERK